MKVLHLITGLGVGGAEKNLVTVLPALPYEHVVCSVFSKRGFGEQLESKGYTIYYLGFSFLTFPLFLFRLLKIIRKEKPDALMTWLIHSNLFGRVVGKVMRIGQIVCCVRNKHIDKPLLVWLDLKTSSLVDIYVVNSPAIKDYMERLGFNAAKIEVIPSSIESARYQVQLDVNMKKKELGIQDRFVIGSVARLEKQKDLATLIRALDIIDRTDVVVLLCGEGRQKNSLQELVGRLGLADQVKFLGMRDDIPQLLQVFDVFILPSRYEGMSNALLEAMTAGCCCIVSDINENTILIESGLNGLVFEQGNYRELGKRIQQVIEDNNLRERLGRQAVQTVEQKYALESVVKQYATLLRRISDSTA